MRKGMRIAGAAGSILVFLLEILVIVNFIAASLQEDNYGGLLVFVIGSVVLIALGKLLLKIGIPVDLPGMFCIAGGFVIPLILTMIFAGNSADALLYHLAGFQLLGVANAVCNLKLRQGRKEKQ